MKNSSFWLLLAIIWSFVSFTGIHGILDGEQHQYWEYVAPILSSISAVIWWSLFIHSKWDVLKK